MPRNRVIYQSEALFNTKDTVDVTSSTNPPNQSGALYINQFSRVQSCNYNFNVARQDVNQFGDLAAIDRVILEQPTVGVDFTYLLNDMHNEKALGFAVIQDQNVITGVARSNANQTALSGILTSGFVNTKNYFIRTVSEGNDASSFGSDSANNAVSSTIGIGNGFITNYTVNAAVGEFPNASVSIEALNMNFSPGNSGAAPGVTASGTSVFISPSTGVFWLPQASTNPNTENNLGRVSALRPGDVTLTLTRTTGTLYGGVDITQAAALQNFSISLALDRTPLLKLGSRYAFSREINFPVNLTLSCTALVQDLTTGNLVDLVDNDSTYDAVIKLATPVSVSTGLEGIGYVIKRLSLDSQDFSSSIGANKEVTLNFSTQIGSPQQNDRGLFMFETLPLN
jgi:hypothetical protein